MCNGTMSKLLLSLFAGLLLLTGCHKKVDPLSKIPTEATQVLTIDPLALSQKLVDDKIQNEEYFEVMDSATVVYLESRFLEVGKFITHIDNFDISPTANVYIFDIDHENTPYTGILFSYGEEKAIKKFAKKELGKEIKSINEYQYILLETANERKILCTWYEDLLGLFIMNENTGDYEEFLGYFSSIKKEGSLKTGEYKEKVGSPKSEFSLLRMPVNDEAHKAWLDWIFPNATTHASLEFEDGEFTLKAEHRLTSSTHLFVAPSKTQTNFYYPDSAYFKMSMALNPELLLQYANQLTTSGILKAGKKDRQRVEGFINNWTGDLGFSYQGERKFVKYFKESVFDEENFEMKIVTRKIEKEMDDFVGYIGYKNKDSVTVFLNSFVKEGLLVKKKNVYVPVIGNDVEIKVMVKEGYLVISTNDAFINNKKQNKKGLHAFYTWFDTKSTRKDKKISDITALMNPYFQKESFNTILSDSLDIIKIKVDKTAKETFTSEINCELYSKEVNSLLVLISLITQFDMDGALKNPETRLN